MTSKRKRDTLGMPRILILKDENELMYRVAEFQDSPETAQEAFPKMTRKQVEAIMTIAKVNASAIRPDGNVDMEKAKEIIEQGRGSDVLAHALLKSGEVTFLAKNLDHFSAFGSLQECPQTFTGRCAGASCNGSNEKY